MSLVAWMSISSLQTAASSRPVYGLLCLEKTQAACWDVVIFPLLFSWSSVKFQSIIFFSLMGLWLFKIWLFEVWILCGVVVAQFIFFSDSFTANEVYRYSVSKGCPMNTYRFSLHYSSGFLHQLSAWGCVLEVKVKVKFSLQTMTLHVTVMDSMTASQVWSLTYHSRPLVACCSTDNESINTDQVKK